MENTLEVGRVRPECVNSFEHSLHLESRLSLSSRKGPGRAGSVSG